MDEETAFPVGHVRLPGLEQNVPAITVMSEPDTTFHAFDHPSLEASYGMRLSAR